MKAQRYRGFCSVPASCFTLQGQHLSVCCSKFNLLVLIKNVKMRVIRNIPLLTVVSPYFLTPNMSICRLLAAVVC